ncbi:MAG: 2-amino-4-hydroxy-6-hydroxymethyldihydropteridine diphosphokinase [Luteibaculaceae bacterium]
MQKQNVYTGYILLGSNLGSAINNLSQALLEIQKRGCGVKQKSSVYKSEPWGFNSTHFFLNLVIEVETIFSELKLLEVLLDIERDMGRIRDLTNKTYVDRIIDLDILSFENVVLNSEFLTLPHPRMQERLFTLYPLKEIAPYWIHPVNGLTIDELLLLCPDKQIPSKFEL